MFLGLLHAYEYIIHHLSHKWPKFTHNILQHVNADSKAVDNLSEKKKKGVTLSKKEPQIYLKKEQCSVLIES